MALMPTDSMHDLGIAMEKIAVAEQERFLFSIALADANHQCTRSKALHMQHMTIVFLTSFQRGVPPSNSPALKALFRRGLLAAALATSPLSTTTVGHLNGQASVVVGQAKK
jgi:hypothetical protein